MCVTKKITSYRRVSGKKNELPRVTMSYHELPAKQKIIDLKINLFFISLITRGNRW